MTRNRNGRSPSATSDTAASCCTYMLTPATMPNATQYARYPRCHARQYNRKRPKAEEVLLCVGLGYGDVLRIGDSDVFGAEVNAASKLGEDHARPYEIVVTGAVKQAAQGGKGIKFNRIKAVPPGAESAYRLKYA